MQRIKPLITIWASVRRAIRSLRITQLDHALNIHRRGAIQILRGVVVDIGHELVDVKVRNLDVVPGFLDVDLVGRAVLVDLVEGRDGLVHAAVDGGGVHAGFVGEELGEGEAAVFGKSVLR